MNRLLLVAAFATLLLSNALGVRIEFGSSARQSAAVAQTATPPAAAPIVTAAASPAPQVPPPPLPPQAQSAPQQQPYAPPPLSPQETYMQDQAAVARINAQIDTLMSQPNGGFAVTYYAKPAPPPREERRDNQQQQAQQDKEKELQPGEVKRGRDGNPEKYVIARAGDTVYATLDRAFNSDDPGAPIFATIHDVDEVGIQGPLDGVRMIGSIHYSSSQGAIQFDKAFLPDGRPVEVKGIAVSEDTARTGIAKNVDNHEIQRYGSLLIATLVQGVGQVGQVLTQNSQQAMVDPNTGLLVASQKFNPYEAAAGALLPAGQALTAVAAQQFNKPATISAPAGYGLGIVFLEPVVVPADLLFARSR